MILRNLISRFNERFAPNIVIETQTGQGNSFALCVVCIDRMNSQNQNQNERAIYIAGTIESAIQIH